MNKNEIDYLSQSLANKYFRANMIFRIMDNAKASRIQGHSVKTPLIFDIIGGAVFLFWVIILGGTLLLCLGGLILAIFE